MYHSVHLHLRHSISIKPPLYKQILLYFTSSVERVRGTYSSSYTTLEMIKMYVAIDAFKISIEIAFLTDAVVSLRLVHEPIEDISDGLADVAPVVHEFPVDAVQYRLEVVTLPRILAAAASLI